MNFKRIIAVMALSVCAFSASAHDEVEAAAEELRDNCVACCLGSRPNLTERLRLDEEKCVTACGAMVGLVIETLNQ